MDIQRMTQGIHGCACGRDHGCPIDTIRIGRDALSYLPGLCEGLGSILLVADKNTMAACGRDVLQALAAFDVSPLILPENGPVVVPDESSIALIEGAVTPATGILVGVGSGVINDLCKHVSFAHRLPYVIVATAPSMDGYASVGAALILQGMKITLNARPPKAILADPRVLCRAPKEMIQAGWGDIIGKFSCLNDWKLSRVINDEYFCDTVYQTVMDITRDMAASAESILQGSEEAVGRLMEALVAVGIAMAYVGNSRPASGSEHHLAHYYEITGILNRTPYYSHGLDVLYSSVVTAALREKICEGKPHLRPFDEAAYERDIRRIYLSSADGVLKLQRDLGWYRRDDSALLDGKWDQITAVLREAPSADETKRMIERVGLNFADYLAFYGREKIGDGVLYAKDLKDRYSVLWLYDRYFA